MPHSSKRKQSKDPYCIMSSWVFSLSFSQGSSKMLGRKSHSFKSLLKVKCRERQGTITGKDVAINSSGIQTPRLLATMGRGGG